MQSECADEANTKYPKDTCGWNDWHKELAQELCVLIEMRLAQIHLEVADHMEEHEPHQHDAGESHDPFLAH
ncbi:unannotated protein [freshwater metagenome]|uniref:Unannotated protein n=1 Tax=freshwater metagenome TaxID=449393 RepID=A0A6J6YDK5_9ZZZZ